MEEGRFRRKEGKFRKEGPGRSVGRKEARKQGSKQGRKGPGRRHRSPTAE
jgi:hypothetical protein